MTRRNHAMIYTAEDYTNGQHGTISGYFSSFNYDHGNSHGNVVKRGAFAGSIARKKATGHLFPLVLNHDKNIIIGRVIDIWEDEKGAFFTAEFFPTEKAQEIRNYVKSCESWRFSPLFKLISEGTTRAKDNSKVTELREIDLIHISIELPPAEPKEEPTTKQKEETSKRSEPEDERAELLAFFSRMIAQDEAKEKYGDYWQVYEWTARQSHSAGEYCLTMENLSKAEAKADRRPGSIGARKARQKTKAMRKKLRELERIIKEPLDGFNPDKPEYTVFNTDPLTYRRLCRRRKSKSKYFTMTLEERMPYTVS